MFSEKDIEQIKSRGLTTDKIEKQLQIFKNGVPFIRLDRPATINDGIVKLSENEVIELEQKFERTDKVNVMKFVPASGAASRMFKSLFEFLENSSNDQQKLSDDVREVIDHLSDFAFYDELKQVLQRDGFDLEKLLHQNEYKRIVEYIIEKGLGYGELPKGLLKFHSYGSVSRTPFEEHLTEGAAYCAGNDRRVRLHFTVSPEHLKKFRMLYEQVKDVYETKHNVKYDVTFSLQKPSTDTVAADMNNNPFRDENNQLVFRPGGHGALIENLNELDNDVIFIKNIDNIVPEKLQSLTYRYKKVLFMLLHEIQSYIFKFQKAVDENEKGTELQNEIKKFYKTYLHKDLDKMLNKNIADDNSLLKDLLFRPIRVCGIVVNTGEPGGGPFWVNQVNGECTLQIVETSQVDKDDTKQMSILKSSTHFNPVDIVCGVKDYKGRKYDLGNYVDPSTGFISLKSKDGDRLKALELPGLWNGAMAGWTTIFVEVPEQTFNPVKTINDLLRLAHQG